MLLILQRVSLVRPAPDELPQGGNAARVIGCSGAMQVAYPFFILCGNFNIAFDLR